MKAYNLHGVNDLRYEDVAVPALEKGWVLVRIKASGICSSDIPRIYTKGTYHFPTIPCHEFSGIVEKVAESSQEHLLGKRVGVFPLIPCRECSQCKLHRYEMCEKYDYIGSRRDGAFAEFVAVPEWNLIELPDSISYRTAAMLEPLAVALHAVKQVAVTPNDRVAVIGTGMIGFAAAQWARALGASDVCVIGRSDEKGKIAANLDGIRYIYGSEVGSEHFSKVIEAVGNNASIQLAIQLADAGGSIVLMGNPDGDIHLPQDLYWRVLRKQLSLCGSWNSSYEHLEPCDWSDACAALAQGKVKVDGLVTHCFAKEELRKGLELMRDHRETYCKVMVEW